MSRIRLIATSFAAASGICAAMIFVSVSAANARPLTPAEHRYSPYSGSVPYCSDPWVLNRIMRRFSQRERLYWHTGREIVHFYRARQIGYRTNGRDLIPKRFCTIRARFNDGRKRRVSYNIGEDLGMAGIGWGVEWCVHGLDYNLAYAPNCSMARP